MGNVELKKPFLSSIWFSYLKSPTYLPSSNPVYSSLKTELSALYPFTFIIPSSPECGDETEFLKCLSTCYRLVNEFLFQNTVMWPTTVIIASFLVKEFTAETIKILKEVQTAVFYSCTQSQEKIKTTVK